MTTTEIFKEYTKFTASDIKSLTLKEQDDDIHQFIYMQDKTLCFNGPDITFNKKMGANIFIFTIPKQEEADSFGKLLTYMVDSLSKSLSLKSLNLLQKHMSKKDIVKTMRLPYDAKTKTLSIRLFNKNKLLTTKITKDAVETITNKVKITKEDFDKNQEAYHKAGVKLFTDDIDYYKEEVKKEKKETDLKDINTSNFTSKIEKGTIFSPKYILDYIYADINNIELVLSLKELKIVNIPIKDPGVYEISDDDEPEKLKVETEKPIVKSTPKVELEEEEGSEEETPEITKEDTGIDGSDFY